MLREAVEHQLLLRHFQLTGSGVETIALGEYRARNNSRSIDGLPGAYASRV